MLDPRFGRQTFCYFSPIFCLERKLLSSGSARDGLTPVLVIACSLFLRKAEKKGVKDWKKNRYIPWPPLPRPTKKNKIWGTRWEILPIDPPPPGYVISQTVDVMLPMSARKGGNILNFLCDPITIYFISINGVIVSIVILTTGILYSTHRWAMHKFRS